MNYRSLGKTGLQVSAIALGTVSLGMDYGIKVPGDFGRPTEAEAMHLIREAISAGVNLFDTAPTYGASERLLGHMLRAHPQCYVASKVPIPRNGDGSLMRSDQLRRAVQRSLDNSLRDIQREVLDIVQLHNATVEVIAQSDMVETLLEAQQLGKVRFLGASVYTQAEALAVLEAGCFDVIQVAYNLLDQRMAERVFPVAAQTGVAIIVRSILLKGALTAKAQWLPSELATLRQVAERAKDALTGSWSSLPEVALRFGLSAPEVATVLVGVRTVGELRQALAAMDAGPLSEELLARTPTLALAAEWLLNPTYWSVA